MQDIEEMRIETKQQTIVHEAADGAEEYFNHVAEVSYLFVKENNEWKIKEAITTNIMFLEE